MDLHVVHRDPRVGFTLINGPLGDRWVRDRERHGWGLQLAYERWTPHEEVARLRCLKRWETCSECWMRQDIQGMVLAMSGPLPLIAVEGEVDAAV